ncbi:uncharacterized protein LOC120433603 [Oreochromis aureus]|uniref:uncharacterized protein LOC120433603 n=1 Tax=Oreochromis aureus TaxID=47969 RepID=UPI00195335D5|nr:uncharacterized protein LOC120433603 [Oreochromis aureus]
MTNQTGRSGPGIPIDKEENREIYRVRLENCMENQVRRVVKKSGEVISEEKVEAIYKRLTNKIWAEVEDQFDEILIVDFNKLYNMIFKALCEKWKSAETVLLIMKLNLPLIDNTIVVTFIEEAAKLMIRNQRNAYSKTTETNTGRSDPGIPIDKKESSRNDRFRLEKCMAVLVKRLVRKSGGVISLEEVKAICKRLTSKIWAEMEDQLHVNLLIESDRLPEMIFNGLCKKWQSAEIVLLMMKLNLPLIDNIIVVTLIEEAAKLTKREQRSAYSKTIAANTGRSDSAFISEPKENVMPGNVTNTEEKSHNHTCNACIDRKNISIQNQKTTETEETGTPIEEKKQREKKRLYLEMGMQFLVRRLVRKSGEVISLQEVKAISMRLTSKIWAEMEDQLHVNLLIQSHRPLKMICNALCKKWQSAETVLLMMKLNLPLIDNIIFVTLIEEAAKLSKRPSRISRFFSFVGRLFSSCLCCMQSSNTADCGVEQQIIVFQSLKEAENKPENEKRNSSHATVCSFCNFKNCNCSFNVNVKLSIPKLFSLV